MQTKDWWYLLATIVSPFLAAGITALLTLMWQDRKEKRDAKMQVFLNLMKHRKPQNYIPDALEWVNTHHLIHVVFAKDKKVMDIWRDLLVMYLNSPAPPHQHHREIELRAAMAEVLGIKNIQQTDIDKIYQPKALTEPLQRFTDIETELLRLLKNTNALHIDPKKPSSNEVQIIEPTTGKAVSQHEAPSE